METLSPDEATALAGTYRLLGRLWMREADEALLTELQRSPLCEFYRAVGGNVSHDAGDAAAIEALAVDYCQLLVGPKEHLPPYQSVWQAGQLQGETTTSMKNFAEVVAYETSALPTGMLLDHFAVQLDVMGHILQQLAAHPLETESLLEIANSFRAIHLGWVSNLLRSARSQARTDFYRSVIEVTHNFLDLDGRIADME